MAQDTNHPRLWRTSRRELSISSRPLVMAILNLTPDSFSESNRSGLPQPEESIAMGLALEEAGADLIDLGAESTRPGAEPVELETEWSRLRPVLQALARQTRLPISVDTTKPEIARRALEEGAEIINDVGGGKWESGMWPVVAVGRAGYILTHSQGQPRTMQLDPQYKDVLGEVGDFLLDGLLACEQAGIEREAIILDPGFGFGKTADHNTRLLAGLGGLVHLGRPLLVGLSRKSFLKKIAGEPQIEVSTCVAQVWAAAMGARIWRVHEVHSAVAAAKVCEKIVQATKGNRH